MPIVQEYEIVLTKTFNFFQKNMNKFLIFFLWIFSFLFFYPVSALQEFSLGAHPGTDYWYNIGTNPRFIGTRSNPWGRDICIYPISTTPIVCRDIGFYTVISDWDYNGPRSFFDMPIGWERTILITTIQFNTSSVKRVRMIRWDNIYGPYLADGVLVWYNDNITAAYYDWVITIWLGWQRQSFNVNNGNIVTTNTGITLNPTPWAYYAAWQDTYQTITYTGTRYQLNVNQHLWGNNWGINSSFIFEGSILWGELQRLELASNLRSWARNYIFRTYDVDNIRYYLLSQCRVGSQYPTAIPGYNNNWYATQDAGIFSGFFLSEKNPLYNRYVYNGLLLGMVDNNYPPLPINTQFNCAYNYAFSHFNSSGQPTRVYVVRSNTMYVYVLSDADIGLLTSSTGSGGTGWGVGEPTYDDQWASCKQTQNDWTQFLWCLWSFFSYLGDQIINFFKAIPAWINKMLEIWTTDTRTISFFPVVHASIAGQLLPDRDPSYGENTLGQLDWMLTGIVMALIFIVTLAIILVVTRK